MIKEPKKHQKILLVLIAIIALEIFLVSSIPGSQKTSAIDFSVIYHFLSFFMLTFLLLMYVENKEKNFHKRFILVLAISLVYAALDEFHQFFVPLRTPDIFDFLVDSVGIFVSASFYKYYFRKVFSN